MQDNSIFLQISLSVIGGAFSIVCLLGSLVLKYFHNEIKDIRSLSNSIEKDLSDNYAKKIDIKEMKDDQNKLIFMLIDNVNEIRKSLKEQNKR